MKMRPSRRRALAGQHLDQLRLAVAGDAGDADDLAGMDLEVHRLDRRQALVVVGEEAGELEHHRLVGASASARARSRICVSPIIIRLISSTLRSLDVAAAGLLAAAQHRDLVGEGGHLAELVGDHQDGEVAAPRSCRAGARAPRRPRRASAPRSARRGSGSAGRDRAASGSRASASRRPRAPTPARRAAPGTASGRGRRRGRASPSASR